MEKHVEIECYKCGVPIVTSPIRKQHFIDSGDSFYCINGHSQAFVKSRVSILESKVREKEIKIGDLERQLEIAKRPKKRGRPRKT